MSKIKKIYEEHKTECLIGGIVLGTVLGFIGGRAITKRDKIYVMSLTDFAKYHDFNSAAIHFTSIGDEFVNGNLIDEEIFTNIAPEMENAILSDLKTWNYGKAFDVVKNNGDKITKNVSIEITEVCQ